MPHTYFIFDVYFQIYIFSRGFQYNIGLHFLEPTITEAFVPHLCFGHCTKQAQDTARWRWLVLNYERSCIFL